MEIKIRDDRCRETETRSKRNGQMQRKSPPLKQPHCQHLTSVTISNHICETLKHINYQSQLPQGLMDKTTFSAVSYIMNKDIVQQWKVK